MKPIEWVLRREVFAVYMDPQDGGPPFETWWEDMRAGEMVDFVKEVYERGVTRGLTEKEAQK